MKLTEAVQYLALFVGIGTLLIGILAMLRPEPMSKKFGVTINGSGLPFVIATGARDVFIGLSVLMLFFFEDWIALGYIHLFIGFVAISDFFVVRKFGDKKNSLVHLFGALIVIYYGFWLFWN